MRRAVDLDPLFTASWTWLARAYWSAGRTAEARVAVERALALSPESWVVVLPAFFALEEGRPAEALTLFERATSENQRLRGRVLALHDLGRTGEAQAVLDDMLRRDLLSPYGLAGIYAWFGDNDRALEALERQLVTRRQPSVEARSDPLLRKLHADPRFWVLLRRAGFPE
jgi:tetratricopeptide (TPR) repeat protein